MHSNSRDYQYFASTAQILFAGHALASREGMTKLQFQFFFFLIELVTTPIRNPTTKIAIVPKTIDR